MYITQEERKVNDSHIRIVFVKKDKCGKHLRVHVAYTTQSVGFRTFNSQFGLCNTLDIHFF